MRTRIKINRHNRASGVSLFELAIGMLVLILIVLPLLDLGALVLATSVCDSTAKTAARLAANQMQNDAMSAALGVVSKAQFPPVLPSMTMTSFVYDSLAGTVTVQTSSMVQLPAEVPLINLKTINIQSSDTEAIVAQ